MRRLALLLGVLALTGCENWTQLECTRLGTCDAGTGGSGGSGGSGGGGGSAGAGGGADALAPWDGGCPPLSPPPSSGSCRVFYFDGGVPAEFIVENPTGEPTTASRCGMLQIHVPRGAAHDFWYTTTDAWKIETSVASSAPFSITARYHMVTDPYEQFAGPYAHGSASYVAFVRTAESGGNPAQSVSTFTFNGSVPPSPTVNNTAAVGPDSELELSRTGADGGVSTYSFLSSPSGPFDGIPLLAAMPQAQTAGFVVGNCCTTASPEADVFLEWVQLCP